MSRLEEEYIMAVVRNRSGESAGEIDFSLSVCRLDAQDFYSLVDISFVLNILQCGVMDRMKTMRKAGQAPRCFGKGHDVEQFYED